MTTTSLEEIRQWVRRITSLPSPKLRADAWQEDLSGQPLWLHVQAWALAAPWDDQALADGYRWDSARCQSYLDHCTRGFGVQPSARWLLQGRRVIWTWATPGGPKRVGFECPAPNAAGYVPDRWRQLTADEIAGSEALQSVADLAQLPCDKHKGSTLAECGCPSLVQQLQLHGLAASDPEAQRIARDAAQFDWSTSSGDPGPEEEDQLAQAKANMEAHLRKRFCLCGAEIPASGPDKCGKCHDQDGPLHCAFCGQGERMDDPMSERTTDNGVALIAHESCWTSAPGADQANGPEEERRVHCKACTNYLEGAGAPAEVYHEPPACEDGHSQARARDEAAVHVEGRDPSQPAITWAPTQGKAKGCAECGYPPQAHEEGAYPPVACDRFQEPGGGDGGAAEAPAQAVEPPAEAPAEVADHPRQEVRLSSTVHRGAVPPVITKAAAADHGLTTKGPEFFDKLISENEPEATEVGAATPFECKVAEGAEVVTKASPDPTPASAAGTSPPSAQPVADSSADRPAATGNMAAGGTLKDAPAPEWEADPTPDPKAVHEDCRAGDCKHPEADEVCWCGHPWQHHDHRTWKCAQCGCGKFKLRDPEEEAKRSPTYATVILERGKLTTIGEATFCCLCGFSVAPGELAWEEAETITTPSGVHVNVAHDECMLKELRRVGAPLSPAQEEDFELRRKGRAGEAAACKCGCTAAEHTGPGRRCLRCPCVLYRPADPGAEPEPLISKTVQDQVRSDTVRAWALQADTENPRKQRKAKKYPQCALCEALIERTQEWVPRKGQSLRERAHLECVLHVLKQVAAETAE